MRLPKPVKGPVTSTFGYRPPLAFHNGQDYGWLYADPVGSRRVYAPISGRVTTGRNSLIGNYVILPMGGGWRTRLTHFDSLAVRNGQTVREGQYLGFMGNDGLQARGVHLHVDVYNPQGLRVNPAHYYTNTFVLNSPGFAGGGSTPITPEDEEDDMKVKVYHRKIDGWASEWMRTGIQFDGGFEVTLDPSVALAWQREHAEGSKTADVIEVRSEYIQLQTQAERLWSQYWKQFKANQPSIVAGGGGATDITPLVDAMNELIEIVKSPQTISR